MTKAELSRLLKITPTSAGNLVLRGCPLTNEAEARAWYETYRIGVKKGPKPKAPPPPRTVSPSGVSSAAEDDLSLEGMLMRVQMAEVQAGIEVKEAAPGSDKQGALRAYAQAAKNRVETEKEILQIQLQRRELVTPEQAEERISTALRPVVSKLDTMAQTLAYRCNPSDPELAMRILEEFAELTKAEARNALIEHEVEPEAEEQEQPEEEADEETDEQL